MNAEQAVEWLEDKNTLHKGVLILYVVDGFEVTMIDAICDEYTSVYRFHGESLIGAISKAAERFPLGVSTSKFQH